MKSEEEVILLLDVLNKNGEGHLYREVQELANKADDDPPLIFCWENLQTFVDAIAAAQGVVAPAPPATMILTPNMTLRDFKLAVLKYARGPDVGADPIGTSVLPCTQTQLCHCVVRLRDLETHPWTQHIIAQQNIANTPIDILPIVSVYIPRPRTNIVEYATPAHPNSLWR